MNALLRMLRGVVGMGLIWAVPWLAICVALTVVVGVFRPDDIDAGEGPLRIAAIMGFVGFVSGVCFGMLLTLAESGKPVLDISLGRAALWGLLASAAHPLLTGREDMVFVFCPLGLAVALTTIAISRKASRRDAEHRKRPLDVVCGVVLQCVRDAVAPPRELST